MKYLIFFLSVLVFGISCTKVITLDLIVSYTETKDNIETVVKNTTDNATAKINSKYLVGCDGAKSAIRHRVGFGFEGGTYENRFYVADVNLTWGIRL